MRKRYADFLEKFAVGSLLIGFYQQSWVATVVAVGALVVCLYLTKKDVL